MREVLIGGTSQPIHASPITLVIYKREFGRESDLIGDIASFDAIRRDRPQDANFTALWQILWALLKTARLGAPFPDFEDWFEHAGVDLSDSDLWREVFAECQRGFFRRAAASAEERHDQP
jgi:hypothetical protein